MIWHVYELHEEQNPIARDRKVRAQLSWTFEPLLTAWPRSSLDIGDSRTLPYLKDILAPGLKKSDDDLVLFTNDDVWLHPDLRETLEARPIPCSASRCDVVRRIDHKVFSEMTPAYIAWVTDEHVGRDLFAFPVHWLKKHWLDIPDFILGCPEWDYCLAAMIRLHHGIVSKRGDMWRTRRPAELRRGYVVHEAHDAWWKSPGYISGSPAVAHNRRLFRAWGEKHIPGLVNENGTL